MTAGAARRPTIERELAEGKLSPPKGGRRTDHLSTQLRILAGTP